VWLHTLIYIYIYIYICTCIYIYLRVVWGRDAVKEARDLGPQVGDLDELLEDVLWQNVRVGRLGALVRRDVDVRGAQVQVGGGDGAHAPVRL